MRVVILLILLISATLQGSVLDTRNACMDSSTRFFDAVRKYDTSKLWTKSEAIQEVLKYG
jgi:hypothetical protein